MSDMDQIRATLAELAESQKEAVEERKKMSEEIRELIANSAKTEQVMRELAKQLKKTDEDFNGKWGSFVEALVRGVLISLLQERGIKVDHFAMVRKGRVGKQTVSEFDLIAINGREVVVVEVKTTLDVKKVDGFMQKLSKFREWRPEYRDKIVYGAVAFIKANESSEVYAQRKKLFVIRAVGEGAVILNESGFEAREF